MVLVGDYLVPRAVASMSMCRSSDSRWYSSAEFRGGDMLCMIPAIAGLVT